MERGFEPVMQLGDLRYEWRGARASSVHKSVRNRRPNTDTLRRMGHTTTASTLVAAVLALSLAGCASPDTAKGAAKEGVQLQKAVEAPLADLNLVQQKIPRCWRRP